MRIEVLILASGHVAVIDDVWLLQSFNSIKLFRSVMCKIFHPKF
jgi:hypothetical protein